MVRSLNPIARRFEYDCTSSFWIRLHGDCSLNLRGMQIESNFKLNPVLRGIPSLKSTRCRRNCMKIAVNSSLLWLSLVHNLLFPVNTVRYYPFGGCSHHGLLVELAQHKSEIRHIEVYSDGVMWVWLAQHWQVNYLLLNTPFSLSSRVKKTQYHRCKAREVGRLPDILTQLCANSRNCPRDLTNHMQLLWHHHKNPTLSGRPPPISPLCDTHRKLKNRQSTRNHACFEHESFIKATLIK